MAEFAKRVTDIANTHEPDRGKKIDALVECATKAGYSVEAIDKTKPWGGYIGFASADADRFIADFFPDIDPIAARLGDASTELSPKFLLVAPSQRLSWQVHERRSERWVFLSEGCYYRSMNPDTPGDLRLAVVGEEIQFAAGECHRLTARASGFTLVAEIWQHTDPKHLSDEDDITRLQDDYSRP